MTLNNLNLDPNSTNKIVWNAQKLIKEMATKWLVTTISDNGFLDLTPEEIDEIRQWQRHICKAPFPSEYLD